MNYIYEACKGIKNLKKFRSIETSSDSGTPLDLSFGFDADRTLLLEIVDDATITMSPGLRTSAAAPGLRTSAIHISSSMLIERSPFFRKLFSNGMRESEQKHVTLQIEAPEEVPFMNLLKYVYNNNLPTVENDLLNLLVIADKYDVASCMIDCTLSLQNLLTTCETALFYLDLPPNLVMSPAAEPLIDAAKQFLAAKFKDFHKFKKEVLNLPLLGIQAVLSSDDLQVTSEAEVFDAVLTWARKHYPNLEERREILETHLLHLVRFPFMTPQELTERLQYCNDIDHEHASHASKVVIRPRYFKTKTPHIKVHLPAGFASRECVARAYTRQLMRPELGKCGVNHSILLMLALSFSFFIIKKFELLY